MIASLFPLRSPGRTHCRGLQLIFCAVALFTATTLRAQLGNDNPTGTSGAFNGNVATGGSYDPFTGNATRSVTDLVVAGGVGAYPLAFTRTANSRYTIGAGKLEFGQAANWRHNYQWSIPKLVTGKQSWESDAWTVMPGAYTVDYPDGRRVSFSASASDTHFRAYAGSGISDRFQPLTDPAASEGECYLLLPDGGLVYFYATIDRVEDEQNHTVTSTFTYQFGGLIDPHGQFTSVTYPADGSTTITEPAGRCLKLFYVQTPWFNNGVRDTVLDRIEERASEQSATRRSVQYNYSQYGPTPNGTRYTSLTSVVYFGDSTLTASYTYQNGNTDANLRPLLWKAVDPMYSGPMWRIAYTFAPAGAGVVHGQLQSENHLDAALNVGPAVSTLTINPSTPNTRTETRGDGPSRTFNYSSGKLNDYTDFRGKTSSISYDGNGYVGAVTDARGKITTTLREGLIGALSVLTHPDPQQSTQRFAYRTVNGAPYYLEIKGDERDINSNTYFVRDPVNHRVTKIWYPDYPIGPTEEFTYNNFGQVETHTMTSGGVENFRYDGRGLMTLSWPPATPSDPNPHLHPTQYFYYQSGPSMDRLWYVINPRGYSTRFEYNARGQTTKITHDQDQTYAQKGYNPDGTLAWSADENHPNASWNANERTRYGYDDYKRVVSVTNPLNKTANLSYAPPNGAGSYSHTTASVYRETSPLNKITTFDYDENFRRKMVRKGAESPDDDGGTWYGYDDVGNLTSVQDPRGHITIFGFDERNRRINSTAPAPFNNQITQWEYDTRSNLTKETRADLSFRRMEYDAQSRVIDAYGFANEHTHYERDLAGNVLELIDPKPATYSFEYDDLNRKIAAHHPTDATGAARSESWHFDFAGNLDQYTNPAGQTKTIGYDTRNRLINSSWNAGGGPTLGLGYDNASRLTIIVTNGGETTVVFGYDDANRQIWEEQTVAGFPTRRVETPRDDDGLQGSLHVPGSYLVHYGYTRRGQLGTIFDGNSIPWFNYSYDLAGNMTRRQDVYGGANDSTNILDAAGVSQYDALNRPMMWEQTAAGNVFARNHFSYDNLGRLTANWRDDNTGDWFGYNATGQLTDVKYNAEQVNTGTPLNPARTVSYTITPDTLNRSSMADNGNVSAYTPNALNQYLSLGGGIITYDGNFNLTGLEGFSASYDSASRLVSVQRNEESAQFVYDGLGRCLKRTLNGETILIAYDGWKPIMEWNVWDQQVYFKAWNIYGPGSDEILWRYSDGSGHLRYRLDRMGNVAFVLDWDRVVQEKYTYDAFGEPTVMDGIGENPRPYSWYGNRFMFTGREYFPELGLYDYRNRFYYPILGRFLQSDPVGFAGGDENLFRYCGGDPVNRVDPLGLSPKKEKIYNKDKNDGSGGPEVVNFGSNGYTPTGSHIPQQVFGTPNGIGWDLFSRDSVNGTQSLGTFILLGGLGAGPGGGLGDGGGAQFVPAQALFGVPSHFHQGVALVNGVKYSTSESLVNALLNAPAGSVNNLTFVGHGSESHIQMGFTGAFTYTSNGQGGYNFSFNGFSNVNAIFSSLSPNATVNFYGCYTGAGSTNIARAFSQTFTGTTVTGFTGSGFQAAFPGSSALAYWGKTITYQGGQQVQGENQFDVRW